MNNTKKLTGGILEEARQLWLDGMGYRPMARYLNEKYPTLEIKHQSLMSALSPKVRAREYERSVKKRKALREARQKEYSDSLKKLYAKK